ncbi:ATP-binding protein [Flectobacillus major]|jgi:signal transduction histidine kinase|uniref:ATP-binding protein n=1 Tax=Flectobacillus major TaxID=103 RepID=UPI0005C63719|nr:type IV pili methyl-accepting chemotaxis transducer N-terminal domain-containing protein [Flectobacillus major]
MRPLDTQVFQRLTRLYVIALTTVAVLSMSGQLVIQLFLHQLLDDSHVINIAGRQRMLSQRLSKTAVLLCRPEIFQADAEHYSQDIKEIISLWQKSHNGLKNGELETPAKTYTVRNSETIDSLFNQLDPVFRVMLLNANRISRGIEQPQANQSEALQYSLNQILTHERAFLKMMDKIVFQYDKEASHRVDTIKRIELILFVLLFIVLILEGLLIFRPIANYIRVVIRKLTDSEKELREANEMLLQTQQALVQATEEKYKLQLTEEKVRSASLMEGQEVERKRLACELHDGIGQMLTGLRLLGEKVRSTPFANSKQEKSFDELQKLIQETIEATRTVSFNLAPSVLSDYGVGPAIRILSEQTAKASGIAIEFNEPKIARLPENIETTLYRITQEALHNAVKYSEATEISIHLTEHPNEVRLDIIDNGKGFEMTTVKKGLGGSGLKNMQTRSSLLNGQFKIQTKLGKGTAIVVKIPILNNRTSTISKKKQLTQQTL